MWDEAGSVTQVLSTQVHDLLREWHPVHAAFYGVSQVLKSVPIVIEPP
jgi:hypothetical protein